MDGEVPRRELGGGAGVGEDEAVCRAERRAFAVDGLGGGDDDLFYRQVLVADNLQHLGGAEAVNMNVLADLRHVPAVGRLVKDEVYAV